MNMTCSFNRCWTTFTMQKHVAYACHKHNLLKKNEYARPRSAEQKKCRQLNDKWWTDRARALQAAADRKDTQGFFKELKAVYSQIFNGIAPTWNLEGRSNYYRANANFAKMGRAFQYGLESAIQYPRCDNRRYQPQTCDITLANGTTFELRSVESHSFARNKSLVDNILIQEDRKLFLPWKNRCVYVWSKNFP